MASVGSEQLNSSRYHRAVVYCPLGMISGNQQILQQAMQLKEVKVNPTHEAIRHLKACIYFLVQIIHVI